jgi:uncharacterized protein YdeI (YjbR/CyaY-like superfamily)
LKQELSESTTTPRVTFDPLSWRPMADKPQFFVTKEDFRAWLDAHHGTRGELLVGFYKRGSGRPSITWPESVDEALSFGWIDGVRRSLGEIAYTIRFTPRRARSIWSAINVARVEALKKEGRMRAAGLAAFAQRTPERTGVYSFERKEHATLSVDEEKALRANAKAAAYFDRQAPWYQRTSLHWVTSGKREDTRARRLAQLIEACAAERPVAPLDRSKLPSAKLAAKAKATKAKTKRAR